MPDKYFEFDDLFTRCR